jgi:hypothetical protein
MAEVFPPSYSTNSIYRTIPQFIQDQDATNNYALWYYIYGICKTVDQINVLSRDAVGPGIYIEADFGPYTGVGTIDAKLSKPISSSDTTIEIFNTDASWRVIDTTVSFQLKIVDLKKSITETITVPAGNYAWESPYVTLTDVIRGTNASYFDASSGADGSIYLKDYLGAPGWSQIVDINRCPDYALSWLGQFVGANINLDSGLNRQQLVQKIKERSGFTRATSNALVSEIVALINANITFNAAPLSTDKVIVLENTQYNSSGNAFSYNQYAMTMLLPFEYFSTYTYQSLEEAATTGYGSTYTNLNDFITGLGGLYFDLAGSTTPSNSSPYLNFVYRYRPAGVQIFVGGY